MSGPAVTTAVRKIETPPEVLRQSTLPRVDYSDAFVVEPVPAGARTAEDWARAMLEEAPERMRRSLRAGWLALGLEIGPPWSDHRVLGWPVRRSEPDLVLLSAASRCGIPAELLFVRRHETLLFSTLVHHGNQLARTIWLGIIPGHQRVVRQLLEQASARWQAG